MEELRGLLAVGVLPEILRRIFLAKRSGILHLASGVDRSDFGFADGRLTRAVTTLPGAHLGDLLVQIGFLSARDRDTSLEMATLSDERLGETLLRLGLLSGEQLNQGLSFQLREVLVRALGGKGGVYTFTDFPSKKSGAADRYDEPRLDPREVLLEATWALMGDPLIDAMLGDVTQTLRKSRDERLLYLDFRMAPADSLLLNRVDGFKSAEVLIQQSTLAVDEAKASLAGLLSIGALEYEGAALPTSLSTSIARIEVTRLAGRIGSGDPFEVLGIAPDAPADEVRSTYLRLLRFCDPGSTADTEFQAILYRLSNQLADAFVQIESRRGLRRAAAAAAISDPPRTSAPPRVTVPAPPPPAPVAPMAMDVEATPAAPTPPAPPAPSPAGSPQPTASQSTPSVSPARPLIDPALAVDSAAEAFGAGRHHEALAILHEAIPQLSGRARGAARVRKARVLLAVENGARLAEAELRTALIEDPGNADAHEGLGAIYHQHDSLALAIKEYRKALELQPRNAAARAGLQQLTGGPEKTAPPRKGLFGR